LTSQQAFKNKYFSKKFRFQKDQQYITSVTKNVKKKTLLNRNPEINCEITRESTQRSLAFHDKGAKIRKEKKTRVYVMQ